VVGVVSLCEGDVHEGPSIWRVCMFIYCTVHTMSIARHILNQVLCSVCFPQSISRLSHLVTYNDGRKVGH